MSVHVPDSEPEPDWATVAETLIDALFDSPDRATAVNRVLVGLRPAEYRWDIMRLARELEDLRSRISGSDRKLACSELARCLYRNMVPMEPPLGTLLGALVTLPATLVAAVTGHRTIALVLALPLAAMLLRIGVFVVRNRRANPADPARLPDCEQLLALRSLRSLPL